MAKFTYRMQNILDIKEKLESQAKISYGIANAKLVDEQQKLQQVIVRRASYEAKSRELVNGRISISDIKHCRKALDVLKVYQRNQMMNVHAAEKNVEFARERLNIAMIERKTHEKLREKEFEEFKKEIQHAEAKEIDELVSYNYHDNGQDETQQS